MKTTRFVNLAAALMVAAALSAHAQAPQKPAATKPGPAQSGTDRYLFAVSEGTSGGIDASEAVAKYKPLANVMEKALGKPVVVTFVRSFDQLEAGMKNGEYDLVMARPSDYPGRGVRDYKYSMVATSKPDGQCFIIVEKSSPLKTVADVKGRTIIFPEKVAYMSKFCTAELRDQGINLASEKVTYAKEQGAVGWAVQSKLSEVGAVASYSGVAKNWEKEGQRVLHKSVKQPYSPLIAGPRVPADRLAKLKAAVGDLEKNEEGQKILKTLGIQGFTPEGPERVLALLAWLEK